MNKFRNIKPIRVANRYVAEQFELIEPEDGWGKLIKTIKKREHKRDLYCLTDFAISFQEIAPQHIELMKKIKWITEGMGAPLGIDPVKRGFYSQYSTHSANGQLMPIGTASVEWFLSFDKYVELLEIDYNLGSTFLADGGSHE